MPNIEFPQLPSLRQAAFDPAMYGGERADGTVIPGSGKVFNASGELNAYDRRDALMQMRAVVDSMLQNQSAQGPFQRRGKTLTAQQRSEYIAAVHDAFQSEEGIRIVGQELLNPIREVLDYEGNARKIFAPREVGPGEVPRYDRDAYITAWTIAQDGITPESHVVGNYFYPSEWVVSAYATLSIQDIYQMQYDALARAQDRAKQAVEFQEDRAGVNLLDAASTTANDVTYVTQFDWNAFVDLKYQIEKNRLPVDKFWINLAETRDILKYVDYKHFDPMTQREIVLAGYIGNLGGVQLIASAGNGIFEPVPPGTVYAVSRPEYVGGMPIRVPLQSEPTNKFLLGEPVKGWYLYEMISQVVLVPRGVAKAVKL